MELKTYYDFANDDYKFFKATLEAGITANSLGALAQNICERFIKHLINQYIQVTDRNQSEITEILSTHNLNRLVSYWNSKSANPIDSETATFLKEVNGYYFSTKYPGDDSQTLGEGDFKSCLAAVERCKQCVDTIIKSENILC